MLSCFTFGRHSDTAVADTSAIMGSGRVFCFKNDASGLFYTRSPGHLPRCWKQLLASSQYLNQVMFLEGVLAEGFQCQAVQSGSSEEAGRPGGVVLRNGKETSRGHTRGVVRGPYLVKTQALVFSFGLCSSSVMDLLCDLGQVTQLLLCLFSPL